MIPVEEAAINLLKKAKDNLEIHPVTRIRTDDEKILDHLGDIEKSQETAKKVFGKKKIVLGVNTSDNLIEVKYHRARQKTAA